MSQGMDPDSVNFLIADIARLMRADFERRIAVEQLGVTPAEARVLAHLERAGPLRQTQLADLLSIAPMSLTGFLDRLQASGLVERQPDPQDRRAKQVQLTAAAAPLLSEIARIAAEIRAAVQSGVDPADWERFHAVAVQMRERLSSARDEAAAGGN